MSPETTFDSDPPTAEAPVNETKKERKARLKAEKGAAKEAREAEKLAAKQTREADKAAAKAGKKAGKDAADPEPTMSERLERYRRLRANVRRRRVGYVLIILLAIAVFIATAWDIIFNDSDLKWVLLAAYIVLFVWGIIMLFSRRVHLQEIAELEAMHRTYLECDHCKNVFQFGELRFSDRKRVGFTCPVCAEESALPGPGAIPVERNLPEANVVETAYACGNCSEQIVVGTFGAKPRQSIFRACPSCGVAGQVSLA